jgi:hypothetical protein
VPFIDPGETNGVLQVGRCQEFNVRSQWLAKTSHEQINLLLRKAFAMTQQQGELSSIFIQCAGAVEVFEFSKPISVQRWSKTQMDVVRELFPG